MTNSEHLPNRPFWNCTCCAAAWPCPSAREALSDEFRRFPLTLGLYMAAQYGQAVIDLGATGDIPEGLYLRFLGWRPGKA
jgi:hypothetical protein